MSDRFQYQSQSIWPRRVSDLFVVEMFISLLCCNICNRCRKQREDAGLYADDNHNASTNAVIDADLDRRITEWQNAIIESEQLERDYLDERNHDAASLSKIDLVRKNPRNFVTDPDNKLRVIALKRLEVAKYQNRLGIKGDIDSEKAPQIGSDVKMKMRQSSVTASVIDSELAWNEGELLKMGAVPRGSGMGLPSLSTRNTDRTANEGGIFTEKISSIWSQRLNKISLLQDDNFQLGKVDAKKQMKPKWPSYLHDVTYEIIKVNKYGQQLKRTLKLTQFHVISIRNNTQITKFYRYSDIKRLWLQNGNIIKVIQRNERKNMYVSPIAPHILQQIITRVQVRHALDHTDFQHGDSELMQSLGYTIENTIEMIKAIAEESAIASEEVFFNFANELKSKVLFSETSSNRSSSANSSRHQSRSFQDGDAVVNAMHQTASEESVKSDREKERERDSRKAERVGGGMLFAAEDADRFEVRVVLDDVIDAVERLLEGERDAVLAAPQSPPSSPTVVIRPVSVARPANPSQRFLVFTEGTPEHKLQTMIRNIVSDPYTDEGNTLKHFTGQFLRDELGVTSIDEKLLKLRNFIDGLHEYVVKSRGYKLAANFSQDKQRSLIFKNRPNGANTNRNSLSSTSNARLSLSGGRRSSFNALANVDVKDIDEDVLTFISFVVFVVVEETAFLPLKDCIVSSVRAEKNYEDEVLIYEKASKLSRRRQEDWSIPDLLISPLGWKTAIFELSQLEHNLTPTHQLLTLTRTMKAVYNEFKMAILPTLLQKGFKDVFIAADDLVPIFLYILSHATAASSLRHPLQNRDLMWALCHPDQLHGEGGYYLTVYESALEFITHETMDDELANRNSFWMSRSDGNGLGGNSTNNNRSKSFSNRVSQSGSSNSASASVNILRSVVRLPVTSYYDDGQDTTMRESFV